MKWVVIRQIPDFWCSRVSRAARTTVRTARTLRLSPVIAAICVQKFYELFVLHLPLWLPWPVVPFNSFSYSYPWLSMPTTFAVKKSSIKRKHKSCRNKKNICPAKKKKGKMLEKDAGEKVQKWERFEGKHMPGHYAEGKSRKYGSV